MLADVGAGLLSPMPTATPSIVKETTTEGEVWVIRLEENGRTQEYRCASEQQARQLALVLSPPKK